MRVIRGDKVQIGDDRDKNSSSAGASPKFCTEATRGGGGMLLYHDFGPPGRLVVARLADE